MIAGDPNVASVELVAAALGELCEEVVLVGGCAASLLIDAPSAPPPRVTTDVDLIAALRGENLPESGAGRCFSADHYGAVIGYGGLEGERRDLLLRSKPAAKISHSRRSPCHGPR